MKNTEEIKNFEESLTYLAEEFNETCDCIEDLSFQLSQKIKLMDELQKKIELWKPKNN